MQKWKNNLRLGAFVAAVVCMLVGFAGMYYRLRFVFSDPLEDMSHGWLVPIFSLYVLWTQRAELKKEAGASSIWGFLTCLPCIGVALAGSRGTQVRFEQFGFIGLCIALPWTFYGRRVAKRCVFPALFLLFSVPVATYFDTVTIYLRLVASGTAFVVLHGLGVDVAQVGTAIVSQGAHPFSIDVAEPCSGLRSLVALTALTAFVVILGSLYCLVAFTPLRTTIPGYPDAHFRRQAVDNAIKIDSLESAITRWKLYSENLSRVLSGDSTLNLDSLLQAKEAADSLAK